jgi:sphinganine-1-phosphate aldolase
MTKRFFPQTGSPSSEILQELERFRLKGADWKNGKTWSLVYYLDEEHLDLVREAYDVFFSENYLNSFVFPGLQEMERDVVRMAAEMCGNPTAVGAMSSGGTESILLAVLAYRNKAQAEGRSKKLEVLAPETAHPAFEKAAHMYGLKLVRVPLRADKRVNLEAMEKLISSRTLMLVVSAPCYPFGVVDPVVEASALAQKHNLPLHVDACIGGFVLPWAEQLGDWKGVWDFRAPGVTSMSLDIHKLGYAAKGASVVLYRDMEWMKRQFFVSTQFPGGIYVSPTLLGSRPGGAIAAAWASMMKLGWEGYLEATRKILGAARELRDFFNSVPGLEVVSDPKLNILAYRTVGNRPDIFIVADQLEEKGWVVDRQQFPQSIHLTVMPSHIPVLEQYKSDVLEALEFARSNPNAEGKGNAAMYGVIAKLPLRGVVAKEASQVFETLYAAGSNQFEERPAPSWMGPLNRLLGWFNRRKRVKVTPPR